MGAEASKGKPFSTPFGRVAIALAVAAALGSTGILGYNIYVATKPEPPPAPAPTAPPIVAVTALGRLEPQGEVIQLSAGASSAQATSRVVELRIVEGDKVKAGQIVAVLDNRDRLQAALEKAKQQVKVAQADLAKVQAGAKAGEIAAQRADIARLQAQLQGEINTQQATIARLQAQLEGETKAQQAKLDRLQAQLIGEKKAQQAKLDRLDAQLIGEKKAQQAKIARLKAQLQGERKTQEATIARLQAPLRNAQSEFERYQQLYSQGAIEASRFDSKRLDLETATERLKEAQSTLIQTVATTEEQINEAIATRNQTIDTVQQQINETIATRNQTIDTLQEQIKEAIATRNQTISTLQEQIKEAAATRTKTVDTLRQQINSAQETLNKIAEIRPVDVQAANAEIANAQSAVKQAQTDLELAYVRAPVAGQILKIHTRPGETIGTNGITEVGQTHQMFVVAEVYESDIGKVRIGQPATITSETNAFAGELKGTVSQIGLQIGKKDILATDPAADVDSRVVEVKIRLDADANRIVAGLTNSKVVAKISLDKS